MTIDCARTHLKELGASANSSTWFLVLTFRYAGVNVNAQLDGEADREKHFCPLVLSLSSFSMHLHLPVHLGRPLPLTCTSTGVVVVAVPVGRAVL